MSTRCYNSDSKELSGDDVQTADAACATLIALVTLTNEYNALTSPSIELVARATITLAQKLSPTLESDAWLPCSPTSPNVDALTIRLNFVSRIL